MWQWLARATAEPRLGQGSAGLKKCCENWWWLNTPHPSPGVGQCSGGHLGHPAERLEGWLPTALCPAFLPGVTGATHHRSSTRPPQLSAVRVAVATRDGKGLSKL